MSRFLFLSLILIISACSSTPKQQGVEVRHSHLRISYDPDQKQARYVVYELTRENLLKKKYRRRDNFRSDPYLQSKKIPQVSGEVYRRSGYDRGHLAPAADFSWSKRALDETFYLSNIAPQKPALNRGAWKRLEERVRRWACGEEKITVITGPLPGPRSKFLKQKLPVPESFFKIVVDETPPRKARAFIYHQDSTGEEVPVSDRRLLSVHDAYPAVIDLGRNPARAQDWSEKNCAR